MRIASGLKYGFDGDDAYMRRLVGGAQAGALL